MLSVLSESCIECENLDLEADEKQKQEVFFRKCALGIVSVKEDKNNCVS